MDSKSNTEGAEDAIERAPASQDPSCKSSKVPTDARLFAHPRLEISGAIARRPGVSFRAVCQELELTDGNLSAHLRALEDDAVVSVERSFDGRRRLSRYWLTDAGRGRLTRYVRWMESFLTDLSPHVATNGHASPSSSQPTAPQQATV